MYVQDVVAVCTSSEAGFWNQHQSLLIGIESSAKYTQQIGYYPADAYQLDGGWLQQIHDLKADGLRLTEAVLFIDKVCLFAYQPSGAPQFISIPNLTAYLNSRANGGYRGVVLRRGLWPCPERSA